MLDAANERIPHTAHCLDSELALLPYTRLWLALCVLVARGAAPRSQGIMQRAIVVP